MLLVAWLLTFTLPAQSANTDYALIMPKAQSSLLLDIAAAGDRLVAVGERGHILYSDDGGRSWKQARVPTSVMLTRLSFISASTGWAVGHDGNILLSTDGGLNWVLQRDGVSDQALINEDRVAYARGKVSDLQRQLALTPVEAHWRVAILRRFEEATTSAANALLKTLEEPPSYVLIAVLASDADRLLPTIVSRVSRFRCGRCPQRWYRRLWSSAGTQGQSKPNFWPIFRAADWAGRYAHSTTGQSSSAAYSGWTTWTAC